MIICLYTIYTNYIIKYIIYYELVKYAKYIKQVIAFNLVISINNLYKLDLKYDYIQNKIVEYCNFILYILFYI